MESRFATLRQRDSSVSMLRVKLSRRRSQCQKENRGKAVNSRRQLEKLSELEQCSTMDASVLTSNMSIVQEKSGNLLKVAKADAGLDRLKQLERWKERKTLEKEKIKRENDRKTVFKTGLYHSKDTFAFAVLPQVPKGKARPKEAVVTTVQTSRVTRSGKRQQQTTKCLPPQKEMEKVPALKKVEPTAGRTTRSRAAVQPAAMLTRAKATGELGARACSTRSGARGPPVASVSKAKDKHAADASLVHATRTHSKKAELSSGKATKVTFEEQPILPQEACPPTKMEEEEEAEEERKMEAVTSGPPPAEALASFAPQGFVFQAPVGLSRFKFEPLTPRSADSFLRPSSSSSFTLPPFPAFNDEPEVEPSAFLPLRSPPPTTPPAPRLAPPTPQEPQHDVPYFRQQMVLETEKLTGLSAVWEPRVEDQSIPEEMRDSMRTVVGQARLLMKERFGQFSGLVDDCELGRGEKVTTCTDLQGFWEMVYYQVEDVEKKFAALKEAEARNWVEEVKAAAPRQRKVVKKPPTAAPKPAGAPAAGRSRLAAAKAAMKAKKLAADAAQALQAAGTAPPQEADPPAPDTIVFQGGFFQVESPSKTPATPRRSLRLSSAVPPQASPHRSMLKYCTTPTRLTPARVPTTPARDTPARVPITPARVPTTPARATTTPARVPTTPVRVPTTPVRVPTTPARATTTPARATTSPTRDTPAITTPARVATTTPAKATVTPARATVTPARATTTPARVVTTTPARAESSPERDTPIRAATTTTPARVTRRSQFTSSSVQADLPHCSPPVVQSQDAPQEASSPQFAARQVPEAHSLSFSLSPCPGDAGDPRPPPYPSLHGIQVDTEQQESISETPDDSVIENVPGLDFERYLQPTERRSLSPFAMDTLPPMEADFEMGSPVEAEAGSGDTLPQGDAQVFSPAGMHPVSSVFTPQPKQAQTAQSDLLLFTPDLRDRIRASVCPSDLMVFTPPPSQ